MIMDNEKFLLKATVIVDGIEAAIGVDLGALKEPLTEMKFRELCKACVPGLAKVVRDHGKMVNPGKFK